MIFIFKVGLRNQNRLKKSTDKKSHCLGGGRRRNKFVTKKSRFYTKQLLGQSQPGSKRNQGRERSVVVSENVNTRTHPNTASCLRGLLAGQRTVWVSSR